MRYGTVAHITKMKKDANWCGTKRIHNHAKHLFNKPGELKLRRCMDFKINVHDFSKNVLDFFILLGK